MEVCWGFSIWAAMFSKQKAAEYFVVAWVKDWTLRSYLNVCAEGELVEWADAHKLYPWLPHDIRPFAINANVRRWTADAMASLNNRLWDAADNACRLKLAPLVAKLDVGDAKIRVNEAHAAFRESQRALAASTAMNNVSIDTMRKGSGSHWRTCK